MNTIVPPTEQEIETALDVISRAAKARKASGKANAERAAFIQEQKKNRALAAECDHFGNVIIHGRLTGALSGELKELFELYGMLVIATYAVNKETFGLFEFYLQRAKKLLQAPKADA